MDEYVINPRTNRRISIHGRIYQKLVREGVFEVRPKHRSFSAGRVSDFGGRDYQRSNRNTVFLLTRVRSFPGKNLAPSIDIQVFGNRQAALQRANLVLETLVPKEQIYPISQRLALTGSEKIGDTQLFLEERPVKFSAAS